MEGPSSHYSGWDLVFGAQKGPPGWYETSGDVSRLPGGYSTCCCAETVALRRGHMTCSDFARDVLCVLGAGVGAEGGALRHVGGSCMVVPAVVGGVVGPM